MINDNCPTCKKELTFKSKSGYFRFKKYNRSCRSCSKIKNHKPEDFIRICKECKSEMIYLTISEKNRSDREGRICKKCASFKFNARRGVKLTESTKKKLSLKKIGKKLSEQTKNKLKNRMLGEKNPFYGKKHTIESIEKNRKNNIGKSHNKLTELQKEKLREYRLKWLESIGGRNPKNGKFFNRKACQYIDNINKTYGWNCQHALNGGEVIITGYSIDGYDKDKNIAIEYDESRHYDKRGNLKEKDIIRMNRIYEKIHCEFYRYNETTNVLKKYF